MGRTLRIALMLMLMLLAGIAPFSAMAEAATGRVAWVIDGDTFRLSTGERIRIAGIDAPETRRDRAKCAAEIAWGKVATRAAIPWLKGRMVTIERLGCSYDRTVAKVTLDGQDLAGELVARGIARPWPLHRPKPDWCDRS